MSFPRVRTIITLLMLLGLPWHRHAYGYSLLTHEQLIDLTWQDSIVPLLLSHYPNLTPVELERARAYAYGGCVIQDIGYYPFGDRTFSNLTHYVRSGDFVVSLFRNAGNANELAFAIGALSHYIGDTIGHPGATNLAVAVEFPKLGAKYGKRVNYAEGKHQHVQAEFGFDIDEIAHHRVAPVNYLRHIGLQVSMRQLALAYYQTYGVRANFAGFRKRLFNIRGYRFAVHTFIPRIAYAVTILHRNHQAPEAASDERVQMEKQIDALAVADDWQKYRRKAGIGTYTLAGIIFILPKFGALKLVAIKDPTQQTEADYLHTVILSEAALRRRLNGFTPPANIKGKLPSPSQNAHPLPNRDLDTGNVVQPGGYPLTDSTYAGLLHHLTQEPDQKIPPGIKIDIQAYYANPNLPITTEKNAAAWAQVQADLVKLAGMPTSNEPEPYPTYGDDVASTE
jgi:hypothetical protein